MSSRGASASVITRERHPRIQAPQLPSPQASHVGVAHEDGVGVVGEWGEEHEEYEDEGYGVRMGGKEHENEDDGGDSHEGGDGGGSGDESVGDVREDELHEGVQDVQGEVHEGGLGVPGEQGVDEWGEQGEQHEGARGGG